MQFSYGQTACLLLFLLLPLAVSSRAKSANRSKSARISFGNRDPEIQKYARFMVSLRTRLPARFFGDNHFCAGTIVARNWVLTAGHCVMDIQKIPTRARTLIVVAGTINRLKRAPTTVTVGVSLVKPHPNFTLFSKNDIALLRLKNNLPIDNPNVDILPLPKKEPPWGTECITLGWGRMYFNGPLAASVSHITVKLFTDEECKELHPQYINGDMCASGDKDRDQDSCRGDSGGPLICDNQVVGVTSWTIGCGTKWFPGIYSNVYYNIRWINKIMNGAENKGGAASMLLIFVAACLPLSDYFCRLFRNLRNFRE